MESVKFRHKITGEIKTQINIMELSQYESLEEIMERVNKDRAKYETSTGQLNPFIRQAINDLS